jgi:NAD+ synthase
MKLIDVAKTSDNVLIPSLKKFVGERKYAVIGISGGVDSAVVAYLCVKALGRESVIGLTLPYGDGNDVHTTDAELVAKELKIECQKYNIKPIVDALSPLGSRLVLGNIMARIRMVFLYKCANERSGMVIGTTNKTEAIIGYYTKYGDGAVDVEPIADLYKTEVLELAKYLGVPNQIISKAPTANLWEKQTDEGEFGMTYEQMDQILFALYDGGDMIEVLETYGGENVASILRRIKSSEHKKHLPPVINLRTK